MPRNNASTFSENAFGVPLYKEVRRYILSKMDSGEWKPGEKIPPELDLAKNLNVALSTVRAGIKDLAEEGLLWRRQGKGTFIARHDVQSQMLRYSNLYSSCDEKLLTSRKILSIRRIRPSHEIHQELQLNQHGSKLVYAVTALLNIEDSPVALMKLFLPCHLFPGLKIDDLRQKNHHLYLVYQKTHGINVVRMEERIHARAADVEFSNLVGANPGDPVLHVHRTSFTFNNVPVELRERTYKADSCHYLFRHKAV
jgi:GntR family transcriptional regulator